MKLTRKISVLAVSVAVLLLATGCGSARRVQKGTDSAVGGGVFVGGGVGISASTTPGDAVIVEDYEAPMSDAAVLRSSPATGKPAEAAAAPIVTAALSNSDFYIEVERIMPRKYPAKETMDGYTVSLKDNILKCYLPYIGEVRYSFSNDDAIAISANKTAVTPKVTMNPPYKKCYALIEFTFKSKYNNEAFYFKIELYKNGNAYITVNSQYRDPITYYGKLEEYPEKNN